MKVKMFDLPCMDSRKSFYGKAKVIEINGNKYLMSYNTVVCGISKTGKFKRFWNGYSSTTQRHINSFLDYYGIYGGGKNWWNSQEVVNFNQDQLIAALA